MTPDDISKNTTPNAIREASNDRLDDLYNRAVGHLGNPFQGVVKQMEASIDAIRVEQAHRRSEKNISKNSGSDWYKKPTGIILIGIITALIVALCKMRWPDIFK